mgnify:CR=1 FL=1
MMFSTSSPTYPASVNEVESAMVNGTFKTLANVSANKVLPDPVGPTNRIFDFESSTLSLFFFDFKFDILPNHNPTSSLHGQDKSINVINQGSLIIADYENIKRMNK